MHSLEAFSIMNMEAARTFGNDSAGPELIVRVALVLSSLSNNVGCHRRSTSALSQSFGSTGCQFLRIYYFLA